MRKMWVSGLCAVIALWAAAVASAQPPPEALAAQDSVPGAVRMSDAWIATRIKAALVPLRRDDRAAVDVAVHEGRVTLSGRVADSVAHAQVLTLARQVRDVLDVDSEALQIDMTPPPH